MLGVCPKTELLNPSRTLTQMSGRNGVTSLWTSSRTGHTEVVEALVKKGADINARGMAKHGNSESRTYAHSEFSIKRRRQPLDRFPK